MKDSCNLDQINESNEPFLNQENGAVKYVSTFNALPLHSQRVQGTR